MIIYLVILPEDQQFIARKEYHLIQNRFHNKGDAITFLNQNKNKYPTAKIVLAELSPEASQHTQIFREKVTFPANSVIKIDENPNLEQNHLDMAEYLRRMRLNASNPIDDGLRLNRAAAVHPAPNDREALFRVALDRLRAQLAINRANPVPAAAHSPAPQQNRDAILLAGLIARFGAEHHNRDIPAAAASPSPVHANREPAIRGVAHRARPTDLPNSLPDLKALLLSNLQSYIAHHPRGEKRREIAEQAELYVKSMDNNINAEAFKKFLMDTKKEIEKTPDHKFSGLWRLFEEIIKKVDLISFAAVDLNNPNLVTQRFPFIQESHLEKARQLDMVCPISGSIMDHPVKVLPSGKYYDKTSIDALKASGAPFICSITRQPITDVLDAPEKKKEIEAFLQSVRSGNQLEALAPPKSSSPSNFRPK